MSTPRVDAPTQFLVCLSYARVPILPLTLLLSLGVVVVSRGSKGSDADSVVLWESVGTAFNAWSATFYLFAHSFIFYFFSLYNTFFTNASFLCLTSPALKGRVLRRER